MHNPTWCPGCGNFGIFQALKQAMVKLKLDSSNSVAIFDIGCNSNMYNWLELTSFESLHGRPIPLATGAKLGNPFLNVLVISGDGGCYGEGANHLLAAARRNLDITLLVHNNQLYALTTGQTSPATQKGYKTKSTPEGAPDQNINPLAVSISAGATFVARGFAGDLPHLTDLIIAAINHKGFSIVDILQPCVTFNSLNTFEWFRQRVYKLENHDTTNKFEALKKAMENEKIPLGIFYEEKKNEEKIILPGIIKESNYQSYFEKLVKEFC